VIKADNNVAKNSKITFANMSGHDLIAKWRNGSQEAAAVLMERYRLRLIALVASRLSRGQRGSIDPEDVVQSAMGSFFRNTSSASQCRLQIESTLSIWNLLAMFARRKLSRSLERSNTAKRGAGWDRNALDQIELFELQQATPESPDADELVNELNSMLAPDQNELVELLLAGNTQKEIAEKLSVDERTVRRRVTAIRKLLTPYLLENEVDKGGVGFQPLMNIDPQSSGLCPGSLSLPRISYGHFVLGKMIGRGGFGKVYQACMQATDSVVAVKFMHRHLWTDVPSKNSFLREIDQASRIDHPGIIKYLGWGESPHGGPYILSELIAGRPLSQCPSMSDTQLVQVMKQVCEAISIVHLSGVIHGDLTPNNILISTDGRAVITDFGLSTCMQPMEPSEGVGSGERSIGGTLGFAAPEQVSPAFGSIGPWTDIYAMGAIAYFCLTGTAPHAKGDATESLASTIAEEDDEMIPSTLPMTAAVQKLSKLVELTLRKTVADRLHDAKQLIAVLSD
jgi:eukaryotic-like serine/threonine-protein kinase